MFILKFVMSFAAICLLSVGTITMESCPNGDTKCQTACTAHCAGLPGSWEYQSHTYTAPNGCDCTCKGSIRTTARRTATLSSN